MRLVNIPGVGPELRLLDPCPACHRFPSAVEISYAMSSGTHLTFSPCGCRVPSSQAERWTSEDHPNAQSYNKALIGKLGYTCIT
jgi:hypothetical protein